MPATAMSQRFIGRAPRENAVAPDVRRRNRTCNQESASSRRRLRIVMRPWFIGFPPDFWHAVPAPILRPHPSSENVSLAKDKALLPEERRPLSRNPSPRLAALRQRKSSPVSQDIS